MNIHHRMLFYLFFFLRWVSVAPVWCAQPWCHAAAAFGRIRVALMTAPF